MKSQSELHSVSAEQQHSNMRVNESFGSLVSRYERKILTLRDSGLTVLKCYMWCDILELSLRLKLNLQLQALMGGVLNNR